MQGKLEWDIWVFTNFNNGEETAMCKAGKIAIAVGAVAVVAAGAVAYIATQTEFGKGVVADVKSKIKELDEADEFED